MVTLVIATGNAHKIQEIQDILGPGFHCRGLKEFAGAPTPVEDGDSFAANATIKARSIAAWLNAGHANEFGDETVYVLADDSGLEVDALNGAPGVHSARFAALDTGAAGNSPDADNNAKLLRLLQDVPDKQRTGRFRCTLSLLPLHQPDADPFICDGACEGRLQHSPTGTAGFGYDPLFIPDGHDRSFAELGEDIKNALSHRARAVEKLKAHFAADK